MSVQRTIEVFSAGCPLCDEVVAQVTQMACPSCQVQVLDMQTAQVADRAMALGVHAVPAVAVDGVLADCCQSGGVDKTMLQRLGVGRPAPSGD